jgi:hypothetical protein
MKDLMHLTTKELVVAQEVEPNQMELVRAIVAVVELPDKVMLVDLREPPVQVQEAEVQVVLAAVYLVEQVQVVQDYFLQ